MCFFFSLFVLVCVWIYVINFIRKIYNTYTTLKKFGVGKVFLKEIIIFIIIFIQQGCIKSKMTVKSFDNLLLWVLRKNTVSVKLMYWIFF